VSNGLPNEENRQRRTRAAQIAEAYRTAHEVISGALTLGLLVWGGFWLDRKSGWSPAFTVCGACLGLIVAGVSLRQLLRRLDQESAKKKQQASSKRESHPK